MVFTVLFYIFVGLFSVQIIYLFFFLLFSFSKEKQINNSKEKLPVSVILYTKNNEQIIEESFSKLINQTYPNFEVVIIDNASSDETPTILEELAVKFSNLKIVTVENNEAFWSNKKYALTLGVKAATHEHIIFTEVDSTPVSNNWLNSMAQKFSEEKEIIIGYTKYENKRFSFFGLLVRFEHLLHHILAFTNNKFGSAFNASEKNFGYTKSSFFKAKGYINHLKIQASHSDLFLKDATTKSNTTYTVKPTSFMVKSLPDSFSEWFNNLQLKSFNKKYYKAKHQLIINLFSFSRVLFYPLAIILAILNWKLIIPFIASYYVLFYLVVGKSAQKLKERQLIYFLPIIDIFIVCIQFSIFITNRISKPTVWK